MNPATLVPHGTATMTRAMVLLFAFCCGAIVANLYYAQPIVELIAPDVGLSSSMASSSFPSPRSATPSACCSWYPWVT